MTFETESCSHALHLYMKEVRPYPTLINQLEIGLPIHQVANR